jgi:hypothetical protein
MSGIVDVVGYEGFDHQVEGFAPVDNGNTHIGDIADAAMHMKTHEIAPSIILNTDSPRDSDSLQDRIITEGLITKPQTEGAPIENMTVTQEPEVDDPDRNFALEALMTNPDETWNAIENGLRRAEAGEELGQPGFPNLAWESLKAGLAKEGVTKQILEGHIKTAQDHQKKIDLLLDLTTEFISLPSDKDATLSQKAQDLLKELKERGITIWEDDKIPKDKLPEVKSLTSSMVDKHRTELQTLFTTKIQVIIQNDASIIEALKNIVKENSAFVRAIIEKFARQ